MNLRIKETHPSEKGYMWPYPARPIFSGDVIVGHLHDDYRGEYVTAIGKDEEILQILQEWWKTEKQRIAEKRERENLIWRLENKMREEAEKNAARKTLGLST